MAESIRVVFNTGIVFAGALIAGSIVRYYNVSQKTESTDWVATAAESFQD
jgi:hypothetical protein